jgi:hypothetical protein
MQLLRPQVLEFLEKRKSLHPNIHEQYFILSWICYKVCHNEWYKKAQKAYLH